MPRRGFQNLPLNRLWLWSSSLRQNTWIAKWLNYVFVRGFDAKENGYRITTCAIVYRLDCWRYAGLSCLKEENLQVLSTLWHWVMRVFSFFQYFQCCSTLFAVTFLEKHFPIGLCSASKSFYFESNLAIQFFRPLRYLESFGLARCLPLTSCSNLTITIAGLCWISR